MNRADKYFKIASQYQLGYDADGNDCEENIDKAIYYYKLAIDFGCIDAFFELGIIYVDENNYSEAQNYFEKALKSGIQDAYDELLDVYKQFKKWNEYLSLFFRKKHSDIECNKTIKIIDYYYEETIRTIDKKAFDIETEFKKITNWLVNSWCSNNLRKRLYQLREDLLSNCIVEKIDFASTIPELISLENLLSKCRFLKDNLDISSRLLIKKAVMELYKKGISEYKAVLKKYEKKPYFDLVRSKIIVIVAQSLLYGDNGVNKNIPQAVSLVSNHLGLNKAAIDFYNEIITIVNGLIKEKRYTEALEYLELLPNECSYQRKKEVKELIERNKINELEQLPNTDVNKKIELAKIYLFSETRMFRNEDRGLKILLDLFYFQSSEEAFKILLKYVYSKDSTNEIAIYEICNIAVDKGFVLEIPYLDVYKRIKAQKEKALADRKKIKEEIEKRNIQFMIHFTNGNNVKSILQHGILSRNALNRLDLKYDYTDENRFDYERDYISTSITNPNEYMLNKAVEERRISNPVLLFLDPSLMYDPEIESIFYVTNAATRKMQNRSGKDYESFIDMFCDNLLIELFDDARIHSRRYKQANETTDIQAEVLIKDMIPVRFIKKLYYINEKKYKYVVNGELVDYPR